VVNVISGLVLGQRFVDLSPEYPTFSVLVTEANRKQLIGNALRALAGGTRTKDALAVLDALELLDGDRVDPANSRYAQEVLNRLKAKGHGQVLNRSELLSGTSDVEYFAPIKYRLEPDLLVTVLGGLVYSGDIVLSITGDKIDSGKLTQLAERSLEELKQFKHVEAPKEINLAVLRALFELFDLPSGLAQKASQGDTEPVIKLQEKVSALVPRVLKAGSDLQQGKLGFWGQNLLREEEAKDWHARLDSLKKFTESLAPYNTVGKLKNLRVTQEDLDGQKKNLEILAAVERLLELVVELGSTASYLSQAEMVLPAEHPWVKAGRGGPQGPAGQTEPGPHRRARRRIPADAQPAQEGLHHRLHRQPQQGAAGRGRRQDPQRPAQGRPPAGTTRAGRRVADAHQPAHRLRGVAQRIEELFLPG
jgi:hypothetical protein